MRWAFLSLGLYAVVAAAMAWPAMLHLNTVVIGQGGDPWQTMWRFESKAALLTQTAEAPSYGPGEGESISEEFLGGGEPRLVNLSVWLWMPLQLIFGQPLTYNLVWLISSVASGYSMYLLVRYILKSSNRELRVWNIEFAALVSGLYFMLLPYHLAHALGHFGAMQLQWLPLVILLLLRFTRQTTFWNTLGLAAVTVVQAWTEHHYMLWLILFLILYSLFFRQQIRKLFPYQLRSVVLVTALLLILIVLPYWPTIRLAAQDNSLLDLGTTQTIRFSADLFSYLTPASFHPVWGPVAEKLSGQHFTGNRAEATHYLGLAALLLVIFFRHKIPPREYYFWLCIALVFAVVSLGPSLHIAGRVLPIPLPYAIADNWPVVSSIRAVGRASAMVGLAMAVLLGWVIATQVRRRLVGAVVAALLVADFLPPAAPLQSYEISPAYAAAQAWRGTRIVELPAATNYTTSSRALYWSRQHGKEVVGTIALERAADEAVLQEIRSIPALRQLLYLRTGQLRLDRPDFFDQPLPETLAETLTWFDVGGIIIHHDSLSPLQLAALHNWLVDDVGLQSQKFADVVIYPIPDDMRELGDGAFLARDRRWTNVGFDEKRGSVFGEIPTEAGIAIYNTRNVPQNIRLQFTIAPESHGNMLFIGDERTEQLSAQGGETIEVTVTVAPLAKQSYVFRNQLTQKIIIQDPKLIVDR